MKKMLLMLLIGSLLLSGAGFGLVDLNATYVSKYIWRGFDLNAAQPAVQPGLSFSLPVEGLALSFWGSYNLGETTNKELTELDATLSYDASFNSDLSYSIGYTYYTFPNLTGDAAKSGEFYAGLTLDQVLFTPGLTLYYDHDQGKGLYAALGGSYSVPLGAGSLSSGLTVGYNGGQWGANSGISDVDLNLAWELPLGPVTITPSVNYVVISQDSGVNANTSESWFGIDIAGSI